MYHYVRAKTASRMDRRITELSLRPRRKISRSERNCARIYRQTRVMPRWCPRVVPPQVSRRCAQVGDHTPCHGGDIRASERVSQSYGVLSILWILRGSNADGRAEINFPGLCKSWRLRIVDCASIKVGSAPNGPRVARELHAGNHQERRALHVTACSWCSIIFFCHIPPKRATLIEWRLRTLLVLFLRPRVLQSYKRAIIVEQTACVSW